MLLMNFLFFCAYLQEVVLSSEQDAFFKSNMYENFGDIGMNIKKLVDDFQHISKSNQNIKTIGFVHDKFLNFIIMILCGSNHWHKDCWIEFNHWMIKFLAEDMAKFVDNYPEYRKMHGNVSKHVTLVTEMSRIVQERKLMSVSQIEQDLACNGGQGAAFEVMWYIVFLFF